MISRILYVLGLVFLTGCSDYKIHTLNDDASRPHDVIVDSADPEPDPEPEPEPEPDTAPPEPDPVYPDIEVSHTLINFGNLNLNQITFFPNTCNQSAIYVTFEKSWVRFIVMEYL